MKKLVAVTEVEGEGLVALLGKKVIVFCANYFYAGELEGVNETCIMLKDAGIVYETGAFSDKKFKDFQKTAFPIYIRLNAIESFSETDKC